MKIILVFFLFIISVSSFSQDSTKLNKQFVAVLTLTKKYRDDKNWKEKEQAIVNDHFQRLLSAKNEGKVILAGRTDLPTSDTNMMGFVVFNAKDEKEATQFMQEDPAVKNKIMVVKVLPYAIAISECR